MIFQRFCAQVFMTQFITHPFTTYTGIALEKSIVQVFSEEPEFGCAEIVIPTPGLGEYELNVPRDVLMIAIHKVQVPPLVEGGCE